MSNTEQIKTNETKSKQSKSDENKPHSLQFEVPLSKAEEVQMFTEFMKTKRKMEVLAESGTYKKGRLYITVVPDNK